MTITERSRTRPGANWRTTKPTGLSCPAVLRIRRFSSRGERWERRKSETLRQLAGACRWFPAFRFRTPSVDRSSRQAFVSFPLQPDMNATALKLRHRRPRVSSTGHLRHKIPRCLHHRVSQSMAGEASMRLLLRDGPMASGSRMKPACRPFFPGLRPSSRNKKGRPAGPPLRFGRAVHAAPARHGRSRVSRAMVALAAANRRQKDGTSTWICDDERNRRL